MKKSILSVIGILILLIFYSFINSNTENETTIKITSEKSIKFDMFQNGEIISGLKTPYEFKFNKKEGNFIFKSCDKKTGLKMCAMRNKSSVSAEWNIIVLTVEEDRMGTFGMN
jgi:hypothetical protein